MATFPEKLSQLMARNGLNQAELSKLLSVDQTSISNWLRAKKTPRVRIFSSLAKIFNVDLGLLTDDSRELPSLTFKEHLDTLKHSGDVSRNVFPEDENRAAGFAEALMGAGLAIKTIPIIEDRLVKLESGMAQILNFLKNKNPKSLKISSSNRQRVACLEEIDSKPVTRDQFADRIEKRIEKMEAVLAKLIDAANAGNRAASLDEIAEARKMADKLSVDISARKRKKNA